MQRPLMDDRKAEVEETHEGEGRLFEAGADASLLLKLPNIRFTRFQSLHRPQMRSSGVVRLEAAPPDNMKPRRRLFCRICRGWPRQHRAQSAEYHRIPIHRAMALPANTLNIRGQIKFNNAAQPQSTFFSPQPEAEELSH